MEKKDKKNKNQKAGVPGSPYEQEKKKHPILNAFIIIFAVSFMFYILTLSFVFSLCLYY